MTTDIHPEYLTCTVPCSWSNELTSRSTVPSLRVALPSGRHPVYIGKQRLVDAGARATLGTT